MWKEHQDTGGKQRWKSFSRILRETVYNIIWTAVNGNLGDSKDVIVEVEYLKEGAKNRTEIKDFLSKEVDESMHEFIRTNVFTATKNCIQRLKALRLEIMLGHNIQWQ